jgi:FdrA protein
MTVRGVRVHRDTYLDSLLLMATTVTMDQRSGVSWAGAVMASPRGLEDLAAAGFSAGDLEGLDGNDLVLAVTAEDEEILEAALEAGRDAAFAERRAGTAGTTAEAPPADIAEAVRREPGLTMAVVSVPGEYAALEAHHALTAGLHVLLFSDNVPVEEEVELKERALRLGLLVMGPGAGTAVVAGTGLGFANVLSAEPGAGVRGVGVVAAAGTGAQEASTLLDRWGVPVTQVIGVGGRDLTAQVGGRMAGSAVRMLDADPATGVVLLVSKPPDPAVAVGVLAECRSTPAVADYLGLD